jgi:hypothetical protein
MSGGFFDLSSPSFKPTMRLISSISRGSTTTITTASAHGYYTGMTVRILVPDLINTAIRGTSLAGMPQINKLSGRITVTGTDTFTIDIDSTDFDAFAIPGTWNAQVGLYPQVVPFAEDNDMTTAAVRNVLGD